ncbi:MAG: 2-C-methyl-D-erythritol 4-phosphate cytidylyltransferase [Oscillospiraceae bacterium]|nr:2-C-methyl-D-erythritol 4-phosphate cytidylyltransferase [Oscillospiraceae bacterium]
MKWWKKLLSADLQVGSNLIHGTSAALSVVVPAILDDGNAHFQSLRNQGAQYHISHSLEDDKALYRPLGGVPLIARTLLALDQIPGIQEVIVVIREAELKRMADICKAFDIQRVRKVVCAKEPGLEALTVGVYECERSADYIAIHDPLRPFITADVFLEALAAAVKTGAGAPAVPVKDTIKIVSAGVIQDTPERSSLHLLQTPQVVDSSLLKAALEQAREVGAMAVELPTALEILGLPLKLTQGLDENIRVRSAADIPAAETILARRAYI